MGLAWENQALKPLAVLHLDNQLYIFSLCLNNPAIFSGPDKYNIDNKTPKGMKHSLCYSSQIHLNAEVDLSLFVTFQPLIICKIVRVKFGPLYGLY